METCPGQAPRSRRGLEALVGRTGHPSHACLVSQPNTHTLHVRGHASGSKAVSRQSRRNTPQARPGKGRGI